MRLEDIIRGIAITDRRGRFDVEISGISADSKRVKNGNLFVAIRGTSHDGHAFIDEALRRGATAVLAEAWPEQEGGDDRANANVVLVPSSRRALALAAANFCGQPSRKLLVAGVTGTNGKTTITYLLESIIRAASKSVGVIGTVDCRFDGKSVDLGVTTPDAVVLQGKLADMLKAGVTHVVMEVSSHALDQQRVTGVHFKVAGFTNLTHDHLDYHKSMEAYFEAKARLFSEGLRKSRARGRMAVVNVDDPKGPALLERWGGKSLAVSIDPKSSADVVALAAEYGLAGTRATVRTSKGEWSVEYGLIGPHNLSNVLVAIGMALAMGFSKQRILRGLRALERVPGRLERVPSDTGKHVFVDYAHTPDALRRVITALRALAKGRILVVFGCGGDRDPAKRPVMGKAVAELADIAVVTNDNPRSESPRAIAAAIEAGLKEGGFAPMTAAPVPKTYKIELDRRGAIRMAIDWMRPDDVLLIAGKGHETYQIVGRQRLRFDDREEARRILAGLPPPPPLTFDDGTSEVDVAQVVEAVELVESTAILSEAAASSVTMSIDADSIVDAVDLDDAIEELSDEEIEEVAPAFDAEGRPVSAPPRRASSRRRRPGSGPNAPASGGAAPATVQLGPGATVVAGSPAPISSGGSGGTTVISGTVNLTGVMSLGTTSPGVASAPGAGASPGPVARVSASAPTAAAPPAAAGLGGSAEPASAPPPATPAPVLPAADLLAAPPPTTAPSSATGSPGSGAPPPEATAGVAVASPPLPSSPLAASPVATPAPVAPAALPPAGEARPAQVPASPAPEPARHSAADGLSAPPSAIPTPIPTLPAAPASAERADPEKTEK